MPLPTGGTLSLQSYSRPGDVTPSKPKQAMIVRMSPETFDALNEHPTRPPMEFAFGPKPGIYIGSTFFPMAPSKENAEHELYLRATSAAKPNAPLKLHAIVTGKFRVERQLNGTIEDKIRDRTQVAETQRTERKVLMLDAPPAVSRVKPKKSKALPPATMMIKKAAHNDHIRNTSVVASVVPSRVMSPMPPTPTTPTAFVMPPAPKDSPIRRRMLQCLSASPRTTEEVMRAVGGADCDSSKRRQLTELLDEVAERDPSAIKGDSSPQRWQLKPITWLEVRPYEWNLTEAERTAMARAARLIFKGLRVPENHAVQEHVRYRKTTPAFPAHTPASSRPITPAMAAGAPPAEAKRGVMSKDAKEKKLKAKADSAKRPVEMQIRDESARAGAGPSSSRLGGGASSSSKSKVPPEASPSKSAATSAAASAAAAGRRLPGSANATKPGALPVRPAVSRDTTSGSSTPAPLRKPPASGDPPRPREKDREREREREREASSSRPKLAAPADVPEKERRPSATTATATATMRMQKKVAPTEVRPREKDREKDREPKVDKERERDRDPERRADRDRAREREREREREKGTPPVASIKRKKLAQEDEGHDSEASKRGSITKKRRTDDGVLPIISSSVSAPSTLSTASSRESQSQAQPRLDLSLPKKPATDLSRQNLLRAGSPMVPRLPPPSQSHNASPSPLASSVTVATSSSSRPREPPGLEKDRDRDRDREPERRGSTSTVQSASGSAAAKSRRRSPVYTSSEDEGEIPNTGSGAFHDMPPGLPDFMYTDSAPAPRPPLPPPWDHVNLRKRYTSSYQEYIGIFSHLVAQKSQLQEMLGGEPGAEKRAGMMLYPDELAKLAGEHKRLKDELEAIKGIFLTGKADGGSPRSD